MDYSKHISIHKIAVWNTKHSKFRMQFYGWIGLDVLDSWNQAAMHYIYNTENTYVLMLDALKTNEVNVYRVHWKISK